MEDTCEHGRMRLYSRGDGGETDSTEIFDDLYLGCGPAARCASSGAASRSRRGARGTRPLEAALGRPQGDRGRCVRVGTFGLGFTLGGLIFGRWRKA